MARLCVWHTITASARQLVVKVRSAILTDIHGIIITASLCSFAKKMLLYLTIRQMTIFAVTIAN